MENKALDHRLLFYGGMRGLAIPFIVLFAGIIYLALTGNALPMAFWIPALAGMLAALILAKNKDECAKVIVKGMASEMVAIMLLAWFLAGIVAEILKQSGLIQGLVWMVTSVGLQGRWFPLLTFLIGSTLSTATGTALGTVIALTPILYPVGVTLGANPVVLLASIVSAAYFGDNIAPVSDTTIASAYTQGVEVSAVVKSRIKYALVAAAIASIGFFLLGEGSGEISTQEIIGEPKGLIMLIVPALLIFLMYRGSHLIVALMSTATLGMILGVGTGLLEPVQLFSVDMETFTVKGIIVSGIMSLIDISVFAMFLMGLIQILEEGGFFEMLINNLEKFTKTPTSSELTISFVNIILNLLTVANSVVIVMEGPIAKKVLIEKHRITPDRSANILDAVSAGMMCIIPYAFGPILAFMFANNSGFPVNFGIMELCMYTFHGWALLLVMFVSIFTGWGRTYIK